MNINTVGNALTFKRSVIAQINEKGIGPIVTEHLPDDMHHENHKEAIIYNTRKGIAIAFKNTISDKNWKNLNTKNCLNELHQVGNTIDTHGEGLQNLFVIAKIIILFNYNETNKTIKVKVLEYGKFFKTLETSKNIDPSKYNSLIGECSKEITYHLNDEDKDSDDGLYAFKKSPVYEEFETPEGKFINGKFNFGYLVNFEMSKKNSNYQAQQKYLNLLHKFVDEECPDIRIKNSQSQYNIHTLKLNSTTSQKELITLKKDDPIKFNYRKLHLLCQIKFFEHTTESGNKCDKIIAHFPTLDKNKIFSRNLTTSQWEWHQPRSVEEHPEYFNDDGSFKWDLHLDIFQIDHNHYSDKDKGKYGWIKLQMENKDHILVNLQPIDIGFIGKSLVGYGKAFTKAIRVVTTIKNMKYSHCDGLKPESTWTDKSKRAIKSIFKDVYDESPDVSKYHRNVTQSAPVNISFPDNLFYSNLLRKSQSKKEKKEKKVTKNKKINHSNKVDMTNIKKAVKKEVAKANNKITTVNNKVTTINKDLKTNKIITPKQDKRHNKPGGWYYVYTHQNWGKEKIVRSGIAINQHWEDRLKQHQREHPIHRIILLHLTWIPYNVKSYETTILHIGQEENIQYNTASTTRSEYMKIDSIDFNNSKLHDIIYKNRPQNAVEHDIGEWNNVTISDEEEEIKM